MAAALAFAVPILFVGLYDEDVYSRRIEVALALARRRARRSAPSGCGCGRRACRPPSAEERERAAELVQAHGTDSLAYFSLRRDKSYFFSPSGRSFLAYRVVGGTALVAGDPIGDAGERRELVREFVRVAHAKGWRVAVAGAANEALEDYAAIGFKSVYLGDEAVDPPGDVLARRTRDPEGAPVRLAAREVRVSRARCSRPRTPTTRCGRRSRAVSEEWRGNWPERGFTMAMDALFLYPDTVLAVAVAPDGRVGGFLQLVPSPASEGYSLASMRRRGDTPNGLMEFLITETVAWARQHAVTELSLNFAVFADFLRVRRRGDALTRSLRWVLLKGDRLFQLERLHSFNRKFFPDWRRRYFCFERWADLPLAGLAYLHAESLLTPPGPWVRSHDLAAQ